MSANNSVLNNTDTGGGTSCEPSRSGRGSVCEQADLGRHPIPVRRKKWTKEVNIVVMECYYRSKPVDDNGIPIKGYRQRMHKEWRERGPFDVTEQRICDQARAIRKNGWLTEIELEFIRRNVEGVTEEQTVNSDIIDHGIIETENSREIEEPREPVESVLDEERAEIVVNTNEATNEEKEIIDQLKEFYGANESSDGIIFKNVEYKKLNTAVNKVNKVLHYFETTNVTETNDLIKACSVWVYKELGLRKINKNKQKNKEPWWKRRIEGDVKELQKHISILDRLKKGEMKSNKKTEKLLTKYWVNKKGLNSVLEELKQRVIAKQARLARYSERILQFKQNRMFNSSQKRLFAELNGLEKGDDEIPDADESRKFWSNIWSKNKEHNHKAEWLEKLRTECEYEKQEDIIITKEMITRQSKKIPNWKAPGRDGVQGFWLKRLSSLHERIAVQFNELLSGQKSIPDWLTYGKTVLCQKDRSKGSAVDNYRPISCLPLMWKLLTGVFSDQLYNYLESEKILPEEQKGCKRNTRGTKDQLLIDKAVLRDCKKRHTNLAMGWIDYRKAYDMVPHSWISECLDLFGIAENVKSLLKNSMKNWRLELTSSGVSLGNVQIKRGIFQGDSLSPLLFVLCLIPMTLILKETKVYYEMGDKTTRMNHLLFMDDLKLFAKTENQIDSLINTVHTFSDDIGMSFGINKCGVLILKRGKVIKSDGIKLPDSNVIKEVDENGYKYLGLLESDKIKEEEMKRLFVKEYKRRSRLILRSKLNGKNKISALNTWAVVVLRYGAGIIKWREDEIDQLDRQTRKLLTMHKAFHPKSDTQRLYIKRSLGGRGMISCRETIKSEENSLGWYLKNSEESLLQGVKYVGLLDTDASVSKSDFKKSYAEERYETWKRKPMYGQFIREMPETTDKVKTWSWMSRSDLKVTTEALICSAQEQALRTKYTKFKIDKTSDSPLCRLCGSKPETISHIISECKTLAQKQYKRRHDNVARMIHYELCKKYDLEHQDKWYKHQPEAITENENTKLLWDFMIQCDNIIQHRKPDIVLVEKQNKTAVIIDVACPGDNRILAKEKDKIEAYDLLKYEIQRLWGLRSVVIVPIVIGALGSVTVNFEKWIEKIGIEISTYSAQKTTLLGTARILRKTLEC